jgi:uncharacterized protein involved in oxidation of intracellular sulfur
MLLPSIQVNMRAVNYPPADACAPFILGDAVMAAKFGQKTPEDFYNLERMLKRVPAGKGNVLTCGSSWQDASVLLRADAILRAL